MTCEIDLLLQHEYINANQTDETLDLLCRSHWKSDDGAPATNVFFDKDFLDKNASRISLYQWFFKLLVANQNLKGTRAKHLLQVVI